MARKMLPSDQRKFFLRNLKNASFAPTLSDYDATTTVIGIPAPKIGMAMDVIGLLGPSGRLKYISSLYLPETLNGRSIGTAEQARRVGVAYLTHKLQQAAKRMGRPITCIHNCEGFAPTFEIQTVTPDAAKPLYVALIVRPMKQATSDPLRDGILGFKPKWQSENTNGAALCIDDEVKRSPDGQLETTNMGNAGEMAMSNCIGEYFATPAERTLLRTLSEEGYFFYGNTSVADIAALRGRLYHVVGRTHYDFVRYEILPEPLASLSE